MRLPVFVSLCYTVGWFGSVLLGTHGYPFLAVVGAIGLVSLQLHWVGKQDVGASVRDRLLVMLVIPLGFFLEVLLLASQSISYAQGKLFPPIWVLGLYPLFILVFIHVFPRMDRHGFVCFMVGGVGALCSYLAGMSLGHGPVFMPPVWRSITILGSCWGAFFYLLAKIVSCVDAATAATLMENRAQDRLDLLYDGACPICRREICLLQQKKQTPHLHYIDISSKEFKEFGYKGIDYNRAMTQIHAIDGQGRIVEGLPVFAAVYARSNWLIASTLLRIPCIQSLLQPLYRLFAKHRLWLSNKLR